MGLNFEWDARKAKLNRAKHGVSFDEASSIFGDLLSITRDDPAHSEDEERFVTIGRSRTQRVLVVAHCDRGGRIRIISARKATRKERAQYEEEDQ